MITQDQLKEHLKYELETGIFIRKKVLSNFIKIGDFAGYYKPNGYVVINVRKKVLAHKLRGSIFMASIQNVLLIIGI